MINVTIIENNGLTALCTITGGEEEFRADLARIKAIPFEDREFVSDAEPKYWRIRDCERYAKQVPEIGDAVRLHKRQLRFL